MTAKRSTTKKPETANDLFEGIMGKIEQSSKTQRQVLEYVIGRRMPVARASYELKLPVNRLNTELQGGLLAVCRIVTDGAIDDWDIRTNDELIQAGELDEDAIDEEDSIDDTD
jgi:hypothetical protein